MSHDFLLALIGGVLIGLAANLMLVFNGHVTGISGILNKTLSLKNTLNSKNFKDLKHEKLWPLLFILGLFLGGVLIFYPNSLKTETYSMPLLRICIAGLLVGFGTTLGNGCTSGHGVCGLSRFSKRSLAATLCFMLAGILTVAIFGGVK